MPTMPKVQTLNAKAVDILNTIRYNASNNYKDYIPEATGDIAQLREIGSIMMDYEALQNEFLHALVNRIGAVIVTSRMYRNPWANFKKGYLEFGETMEEIFVNIAKPFVFDGSADGGAEVWQQNIPDVRAAFHTMNYQIFYPVTIKNDMLRQAFLSWNGITDLIARIVDSLYTAANYDEFVTMKFLLARHILDGHMTPISTSTPTAANSDEIATEFRAQSSLLTFPSTENNIAGVFSFTPREDQILIINAKFEAVMDVNTLATAFNMDKAEFLGRRVVVDSFGSLDTKRLALLFPDATNIPTADELTALDAIPAILVDRNFFQIYDNFQKFTENYNGRRLYWNYFYHVWKTFSVSPFHNALVFVPGTPSVTSVTVSPAAVTAAAGQTVQLSATVVTEGFASKAVSWTSSSENSPVTKEGLVTIGADEASAATITVTATSVEDSTKKGVSTITVS